MADLNSKVNRESFSLFKHVPEKPISARLDLILRFCFFVIGFSPIAALSLSVFRGSNWVPWVPLHISGPCVVLPAIITAIVLCLTYRKYAPRVIEGLAAGIIAVTLYDMFRMPFLDTGVWPDFIPKIGSFLLNQPDQNFSMTHWMIGYIWRYVGNGGGMGLAFYLMFPLFRHRLDSRIAGMFYGIIIFCCLLATIYLSPAGRFYLFDPSFTTGTLGFLGHVVYGLILGIVTRVINPELDDKRKTYLIDRKMQLSISAFVGAFALFLCVFNLIMFSNFLEYAPNLINSQGFPIEPKDFYFARRTMLTVLVVTGLFFVIIIVAFSVFFTNRIAGPLYSLRKQLAKIRAGDLDHSLNLRKGDYLQRELAQEYNETLAVIRMHWSEQPVQKKSHPSDPTNPGTSMGKKDKV